MMTRIQAWLRGLMHELPPEVNYCETDCQKTTCSDTNFACCADRLNRMVQLHADPQLAMALAPGTAGTVSPLHPMPEAPFVVSPGSPIPSQPMVAAPAAHRQQA